MQSLIRFVLTVLFGATSIATAVRADGERRSVRGLPPLLALPTFDAFFRNAEAGP